MPFASRSLFICLFAFVFGPCCFTQTAPARTPSQPPKLNKAALVQYLRYAEGYSPNVEMNVDDPKPSAFPGFYEVDVHLIMRRKTGGQEMVNEAARTYYVTQDGERVVSGALFDLNQSPFITNLQRLKQEGAPSFGPDTAPVQIYVFSDFECPYCRSEAKVLRQGIDKSHANDVKIIFKDFPLDAIHPWARTAAVGGQCIAQQDTKTFWTFHDWIYEHQPEITPANVKDKITEFAKGQSLDLSKFSTCLADPAIAARVQKTVVEGRHLGIDQTPTLFVNGRLMSGALRPEQINLVIQMELDHGLKKSATTSQKCCEVSIPALGQN
jgi:protein-disulfide isomerase